MSDARKTRTKYEKPKLLSLDRWDAEASGQGYGPLPGRCQTAGIVDLVQQCSTAGILVNGPG